MSKIVLQQWKDYLKHVKLDEATMPADQQREMKRCFFAAWAQLLIYQRDDMDVTNEDAAARELQEMLDETEQFFNVEVITHDALQAAKQPDTLDENGFFFIGSDFTVAWCRIYGAVPVFCQYDGQGWLVKRQANQTDVWAAASTRLPQNLDAGLRVLTGLVDSPPEHYKRKADALMAAQGTPYAAALGKNGPKIQAGLKFISRHMPGVICTVISVWENKNLLAVDMVNAHGHRYSEDDWNLAHSIAGFERGEYIVYEEPKNPTP